MRAYLLIDFGSTYTKVTAVDAETPRVLGRAKAPTTVETDITIGLRRALDGLRRRHGHLPGFVSKLACSSAAGGLRMVAVGLVPDLTGKAARQAALGAGARVVGTYAYRIQPGELAQLEAQQPDMVLLAGGTDGGNAEIVLHNARMLAGSRVTAPIVFAGNRDVREQAVAVLRAAGKTVRATANVMPRLYELDVNPARQVIRELFLEHIVLAKGLDRARAVLDDILMPTPAAVLRAAELLADGTGDEPGVGPLAIIDVGGATTDIHTISPPGALEPNITVKGLEEPYSKRTVEGDLGMRVSAPALLEAVGTDRLQSLLSEIQRAWGADSQRCLGDAAPGEQELLDYVHKLSRETDRVPRDTGDWIFDTTLGRAAAGEAVRRHAGRLQRLQTPMGLKYFQHGKDLRPLKWLVGTGGVFVHCARPELLFADVLYDSSEPEILRPLEPRLAVDAHYLLAPMGLLAEREPEAALRLMQEHLRPVEVPSNREPGRK